MYRAVAALIAVLVIAPLAAFAQDSPSEESCVIDPEGDVAQDAERLDIVEACIGTDGSQTTVELFFATTGVSPGYGWDGARAATSNEPSARSLIANGFNDYAFGTCRTGEGDAEFEVVEAGGRSSFRWTGSTLCLPEGTHTLTWTSRQDWDDLTPGGRIVVTLDGHIVTVSHDGLQSTVTADTRRISGPSRYETAVAVTEDRFPNGNDRLLLVNANTQVDALPAATGFSGVPLLYVPSSGAIPTAVLDEIARLNPREIIALGGTAAVGDDVLAQAQAVTEHSAVGE